MFKKIFFTIITIFLSINCNAIDYESYLKLEIKKHISEKKDDKYFNIEDKNFLSSITDPFNCLEEIDRMADKKRIAGVRFRDSISYYSLLAIILKKASLSNDIEIRTYTIKILTRLNRKLPLNAFSYSGIYKNYYDLVMIFFQDVDRPLIIDFIKSIPDLKFYILSNLYIFLEFKYKVDYKEFYNVYVNINKGNYKKLLSGNMIIFQGMSIETIEGYIEPFAL